MSVKTSSSASSLLLKAPLLAACAFAMSGCSDNDGHVIELRQLREKLAMAEKKAAEAAGAAEAAQEAQQVAQQAATAAASAASTSSAPDMAAAAQKLTDAESRIAALQKELLEAKNAAKTAAQTASTNSSSKGNADNFREFVKTMERDLLSKTSDLQQSVEQALPTANIQETTVKRLRLPDEIASAFNSAVVFILADAAGQQRRLEFPVQAGLDGQWRLPGSADVQKHIASVAAGSSAPVPAVPAPVQPQPVTVAAPASNAHVDPHVPAPLAQPSQQMPQQQQPVSTPASAPGGSKAGGPQTVVIKWDNSPTAQAQSAAAAPTTAAPAPQPSPQTPQPSTAAAPAKPTPTVPKAVMPVKQDVQIRFE